MINQLKWALSRLTVSALAGAIASHLFAINFWLAASIGLVAIWINGIVGWWEDKGTFNT